MSVILEERLDLENAFVGDELSDLDKIHTAGTNLAIWRRETVNADNAIKELLATPFTQTQFIYNRSEPIQLIGAHLDEITQLESEDSVLLWDDIMNLAIKMLELCDDEEIGIGLERIQHDNCKSFHTDFLSLRLLCTYWGDTTEWLENKNVNRDWLGKNDNDKVVRDWSQVHKMQRNWVGVFKGENFEKNKGLGIVHRSPEITGQQNPDRLLLRIDTIKSFGKHHE